MQQKVEVVGHDLIGHHPDPVQHAHLMQEAHKLLLLGFAEGTVL